MTTATNTAAVREVPADVAATWQRLAQAREAERHWKTIADDLAGQLRATLGPGSFAINGTPAFSVTAVPKFSAEQAKAVLTPEQIALCSEPTLSAELIKARLGTAIYDACRVATGKPTVRATS